MQTLTDSAVFPSSASHERLAFGRLQIIQNYIASTKQLIAKQERHVRLTGAVGTDTAEDRMQLIVMRQSLAVMERYQQEILESLIPFDY